MSENAPTPTNDTKKTEMTPDVRAAFERSAQGVALQFGIDLEDVRNAYESKPESLSLVFDAASEAKSDRNGYIGWSVAWLIIFPPIALYTGYKAFENFDRLDKLGKQVNREVERARMPTPN